MGSMALDGIGGFPTRDLVKGLMSLEYKAAKPVYDRRDALSNKVQALQGLNAKISSIRTNAWGVLGKADKFAVADPDKAWQAAKGTSSNPTVEVNAREGAQIGSLNFDVINVAQTQQATIKDTQLEALSDRIMKSTPPAMSIVVGGKVTTIKPASGSAMDMAKAINAAKDSGISATAVRVGEGKYVLQVTGKTTGATEGKFEIYSGDLNKQLEGSLTAKETSHNAGIDSTTSTYDKSELQAALAAHSDQKAELTVSREASDAKITLWAGTNSEQVFTQSTNTFKDIMPNVDITIGKAAADAEGKAQSTTPKGVSVDVQTDPSIITDKVKKLVGSINLVVNEITSRTRPVEKVRDDGVKYQAPGVLGTSGVVRQIDNGLRDLMGGGITLKGEGPVSLSEFGIKLGYDKGSKELRLDFDESAFQKALSENPNRVQAALNSFAEKAEKLSGSYADSTQGILTNNITSQQSAQRRVDEQISNIDRRMESRKKSLELQFARLQTILQKNQAQSSWLAGQLGNLPGPR